MQVPVFIVVGGVGFEATPSGSEGEVQLFAQVR